MTQQTLVDPAMSATAAALKAKLDNGTAVVGVIGLGYVGQPLAMAAHAGGLKVIGFDIDAERVAALNAGQSTIRTIAAERVQKMVQDGRFRATADFSELSVPDIIVICVPTPLNKNREPDLSFVKTTAMDIARTLRAGQLVCLESTTYPGTTREELLPRMEAKGFKVGDDAFLAFSPEREDPGNKNFHTVNIPKIVGADDPVSGALAKAFYSRIVDSVYVVSSSATAEAVKLTENIFRCVNIALVNELKHIYDEMGINVWDVIDAAATKPFGFMAFYPGPGLGGHCIPIDPFYLSWKAREYSVPARFIELAGEVNTAEPGRVVSRLAAELSARLRLSLNGARVLLLGVAYKKNIDDMRESPALTIFEAMERAGAVVQYYDPWIPEIPRTREHATLTGRKSVTWDKASLAANYDVALIVTDHDGVDYAALVDALPLVVDTRNATRAVAKNRDHIVLA